MFSLQFVKIRIHIRFIHCNWLICLLHLSQPISSLSFLFSFSFFFFCEEDWPLANICCHSSSFCLRKIVTELTTVQSSLLYVEHCYSTAWWAVCRSVPRIRPCEPKAAKAECMNFTTTPPGWPQERFPIAFKQDQHLGLTNNSHWYS